MSRFDYVKYDEIAATKQLGAKNLCESLEQYLNEQLPSSPGGHDAYGREKALALTALEEVYMWIGKAIRDDQIARNGSAPLAGRKGQLMRTTELA